jgi:serine/threonine protein kinase
VLLTLEGRPKLCDFGIAHVDGAATLTESAAILGSLRYMAPEQRLGRSSPQTDLYALGVTLHEALTGGSVPDEAPLPPDVPRRLRRLVTALTQLRAADRPKDAAAALTLLRPSRAARLAEAAGVQTLAVVTSSARVGAIIAISLVISVAVGWVIARPRLQTPTDSSPSFKPPPEFPGEVKTAAKEPEPAPTVTPRPTLPLAPFPAEKKTFAEEMEAALGGAAGIDLNRRATVTPSGGVELPAGKPPAPKRTLAPTTTPSTKDGEPLPPLEPAPLGEPRAKPLDFEGRLQELDAKDPAKGASVRSKLETLDPASAEAKRKKGSATAPRAKLPPRSNFKDDEDWLQAVDRIDPRTGSLLRAKLGK